MSKQIPGLIAVALFVASGCGSSSDGQSSGAPGSDAGADSTATDAGTESSVLPDGASPEASTDSDATDEGGEAGPDVQDATAPNPACEDAIDITADMAANGVYNGDATDSPPLPASCVDRTSPKSFLKYLVATAGNYRIEIDSKPNTPSTPDAALIVRYECSQPFSEVACNSNAVLLNTYVGLKAGYVFLVVDGDYYSGGFDLRITPISQCFSDTACSSMVGALCDTDGVCVSCLGDGDCLDGVCDADWGTCRPCFDDTDCVGDSGGAHCITATGVCGCIDADDCPDGLECDPNGVCIDCKPGWNDCDGWNGCESDPMVDPDNCGGCGNDCGSATCVNGVCGTAPETVMGDGNARRLTTDGQRIYFATSDDIRAVGFDGGQVDVLASSPDIGALVVGADRVYWNEYFDIKSVAKQGGTVETVVADSASSIYDIVVDSENLYWVDGHDISRVSKQGGSPTVLFHSSSTISGGELADCGTAICYSLGGQSVWKVPKAGGTPVELSDYLKHCGIVADAVSVYGGASALSRVPIAGGATEYVVPNSAGYASCFDLWVDTTKVYFSAGGMFTYGLYAVPKSGGTVVPIASDASQPLANATHVFWLHDQNILRTPK